MKLREVRFDRYAGRDSTRGFTDRTHHIDLDTSTLLILITPKVVAAGEPVEPLLLVAHNCDMYPAKEEAPSEPGPARPLPGRSRKGA